MELAAVMAGASVFLLVWVVLFRVVSRTSLIHSRVTQITGHALPARRPGTEKKRTSDRKTGRDRKRTSSRHQDARTRATTWLEALGVWLKRADIHMSAQDYAIRWMAIVLFLTFLCLVTPARRMGLLIPTGAFVSTAVYLRMRMQKRLRLFQDGLYDLLMLVSNALRAGNSFVQALHLVAEESAGPIRQEIGRLEGELQMGVTLEDALDRTATRVGSEDFDLIVTAIGIQRQVGGNLAEVLERIAETIGERVKLKSEVKALTAQGRMSSLIFMALPAGLALILEFINPAYMTVLFRSSAGLMLLLLAGIGQGVGYMVIRKIVRVEL